MDQPYILPILDCQYHSCWCPGDWSHQGISRCGIDPINWNIPSLASEELMYSTFMSLQLAFYVNLFDIEAVSSLSQVS